MEVPFSRCGSLLVTYDPGSVPRLERKLENGRKNHVPGLKLISGADAERMEPMLKKGAAAALYAPSTGTVNPWQLGIAAFENALGNGAEVFLNTKVTGIQRKGNTYTVQTERDCLEARMVFNCTGLSADRVQELAFKHSVRLKMDGAEYLVLDPHAQVPHRVIFHQAHSCGKGITAIPCVEGNLLISGVRKELARPFAATMKG